MTKSFIIVYFLNGEKYKGDVYVSTDTNNYGFACFADPYYRFELDVRKIYIDENNIKTKKENSMDTLFCYV
jgi:hypothetical protein